MPPRSYRVRPARPADASALPEIERRAAERFRQVGLGALADGAVTEEAVFREAAAEGRVWVAEHGEGELVGFALARRLGAKGVHLQEMDVVPEHGRRGLGARLVNAVLTWARAEGAASVTLTTFRDVPWNAPYYRRLGFEELPESSYTPELRHILAAEIDAGFVPGLRLVMSRLP